MILAYVAKLDLTTQKTSIGAQKIDGLTLRTYDMALASFLLWDRLGKIRFFKKIFLLADTSMKMILKMFFFSLSNANLHFDIEKLS